MSYQTENGELIKYGPDQGCFNPNLEPNVASHVEGGDSSIHAGVRLSFLSPISIFHLGQTVEGGRVAAIALMTTHPSLPPIAPSPFPLSHRCSSGLSDFPNGTLHFRDNLRSDHFAQAAGAPLHHPAMQSYPNQYSKEFYSIRKIIVIQMSSLSYTGPHHYRTSVSRYSSLIFMHLSGRPTGLNVGLSILCDSSSDFCRRRRGEGEGQRGKMDGVHCLRF